MAKQNFSKVARIMDVDGVTVIMKNNVPRYVLFEYIGLLQSMGEM